MLSVGQMLYIPMLEYSYPVGPLLKKHQRDCEIYKISVGRRDYVVKVKPRDEIRNEMSFLMTMDSMQTALFPLGDACGFSEKYGWILMAEYDYTLESFPDTSQHWKRIMQQCVDQLQDLHTGTSYGPDKLMLDSRFGYIHGDVKNTNILINRTSSGVDACIGDYGMVRNIDSCMKCQPPSDHREYFVNYVGAKEKCNWGPRCDLESLGIHVAATLSGTNLISFYKDGGTRETVTKLSPLLSGYFDILSALPWDERIKPQVYEALLSWLKT